MSKSILTRIDQKLGMIENILLKKSYGVEYQPFISTQNGEVMAYEALSRFTYNNKKISPDIFFKNCHDHSDLFFQSEQMLKKFQFENRPLKKKLFVNFDPHIFLEKEKVNEVFHLFSKQENFVIELVENSHESINTNSLLKIFEKLDYDFAIDDFFKENSMLSLELLKNCDYLKLDKDILREMNINKHFFHIVEGLVKFSHAFEKKVVLEGVEIQKDFELAKMLHIDYVQGFLFKSEFIKEMHSEE